MGVLDPICITTDPEATAFYGCAYADEYNCFSYNNGYGCNDIVLIKSNTNPTKPEAMTWSLVSRISSRNLTAGVIQNMYGATFSCTINAQGVFTMFGVNRDWYRSITTAFGIRYDPAGTMDAAYNFKGPGAWMNMTIDAAYNWTDSSFDHKLAYVNNGVTSDLIHAVLDKSGNKIRLAKVDDTTKTLTAAGYWVMNSTIHGSIQGIGIGNNHLYTFGTLYSYSYSYSYSAPSTVLTGFPLATVSPTTPVGKSYNTSQVINGQSSTVIYLYYYQNVLTLICGRMQYPSYYSTFYKITDPDNAVSTGPATNFTNQITYMDFFVPLGDGTGPTSFALMKSIGTMYVFGNDNGFRYTHMINKVSISDPVGINPNPNPPQSSGSQDDSSSTGIIVGVIMGMVFIVGVLTWLIRKSMGNTKANSNPASKPLPPFPPASNYGYPQQPGQYGGGPNYYSPAGLHPVSAPTTILPMAPITPVPPQQIQSMQEQMQALQFSSHPRPSFVTTAYGGEPVPSDATSANTSGPFLGTAETSTAPWQPTPFVPPARTAGSVGATTHSGGGSPAFATAFSSTAAQSPQNPQEWVSQYSVESPTPSASTPLSPPQNPQAWVSQYSVESPTPSAATSLSPPQNPHALVSQYSVESPTPSASTPLSSPPSVPRNSRPSP